MTVLHRFKPIVPARVKQQMRNVLGDYFDTAMLNVESRKEHLYVIDNYATCLLRAERLELVVVGFVGVGKLAHCAPLIVQLAKECGAKSIRVHTKRRGECRFLNKLGLPFTDEFINNEYILRMVIDGRR